MSLRSRLSRFQLKTKLLVLEAAVLLAFGVVTLAIFFSMHQVNALFSNVIESDVSRIVANGELSRDVAAVSAGIRLIAASFYGNDVLLNSKSNELAVSGDRILADVAGTDLAPPINLWRHLQVDFITQCQAVNGVVRARQSTWKAIEEQLRQLEQDPVAGASDRSRGAQREELYQTTRAIRDLLLEAKARFIEQSSRAGQFMQQGYSTEASQEACQELLRRIAALPPGDGETGARLATISSLVGDCVRLTDNYGQAMQSLIRRFREMQSSETDATEAIDRLDRELISRTSQTREAIGSTIRTIGLAFFFLCAAIVTGLLGLITYFVNSNVMHPLGHVIDRFRAFGEGDRSMRIDLKRSDDWAPIERTLNNVAQTLSDQDWLKTGQAGLDEALRGELSVTDVASRSLTWLARHLDARLGAIYLADESNSLQLSSGYALSNPDKQHHSIPLGEGVIGQAARNGTPIRFQGVNGEVPDLDFGPGRLTPEFFVALPLEDTGQTLGVLLLGSTRPFTDLTLQLLERCRNSLVVSLLTARSHERIQALLLESQNQAEMLQQQQEELRQTNDELAEQAKALRESEETLQAQQEELRVTNEELAEQTRALRESERQLQDQQEELRASNAELASLNARLEEIVDERTRDLARKAQELELANQRLLELDQLKSSFLSSVSHELRTPLTSVLGFTKLIHKDLARSFWRLAQGDEQLVKKSERIQDNLGIITHEAERLSRLINDVLDLNKIESGRMAWHDRTVIPEEIIARTLQSQRGHLAGKKQLKLLTEVAVELPVLFVDPDRLEQVLINLLSNAIKFTDRGHILVRAFPTDEGWLHVEVQDTGPGIPADELSKIFDKFHQARARDTLVEKPAGTGLGLTICREIVEHYHGRIWVESQVDVGSSFFLELPAASRLDNAKASTE